MYRDTGVDPRITALTEQIAREQEIRDELVQVRFQQDGRMREVDELEVKLAKLERGGLFGLGKGSKAARAEVEENLRVKILARDMSVAREHQLAEALADIDGARRELANLEQAAAGRLRSMGGPLGDELRAISDSLAATERARVSVAATATAGDLAITALRAVEMYLMDPRTYGNEPYATAIPGARSALFGFAYAAASIVSAAPLTRETANAARMLEHEQPAMMASTAIGWISRMDSVMSELAGELRRLDELRAAMTARERQIAAEATGNF